jgi:hypothetical protein
MYTYSEFPRRSWYFDWTLNKRRAGKAEMNLDPTGSPRHEQTVAVALRFIVAQSMVQPREDKSDNGNRR